MRLARWLLLTLLVVGLTVFALYIRARRSSGSRSVAAPSLPAAQSADQVTLEVYDPTGAVEVTQLHAPRIDTLVGRTICMVSNGSWEDQRTFPVIMDGLQKKFPDAKIVPASTFPVGTRQIDVDAIGDLVKKAGCQAAVVGNAG